MSAKRPSRRDRLERELLQLAEQRARSEQEFTAQMLAIQRELERVENGGPADATVVEREARRDGLDCVAEACLAVLPGGYDSAEPGDEVAAERAASGPEMDWRAQALRMTQVCVGVLRAVAYATSRPKLEAFAGLFALGADCESMRAVAKAEGVTFEWVSEKTEQVRVRFNLPRNQHNKSAQAVGSYRASAQLRSMEK